MGYAARQRAAAAAAGKPLPSPRSTLLWAHEDDVAIAVTDYRRAAAAGAGERQLVNLHGAIASRVRFLLRRCGG